MKNKKESKKSKILRRRKKIREERKKEKEAREIEEKYRKKKKPFVKNENPMGKLVKPNENEDKESIKKRLNNHLETLDALEKELESEEEVRTNINENYEDQGIYDMKSKMEKLQESARSKQKNKKSKMQGSAEVKFNPNK